MNDVWFGSSLTHRDVETILQALSLQGDRSPALIAVADAGATLALASRALFRFFDVADADALAERLLEGRDPGARRLAILSRNMTLDGAPRLERLRFSVSPASEVVTFLCRRIVLRGVPIFIAAALGLRADDAPASAALAEPAAEPPTVEPTPVSAEMPAPAPEAARSADEAIVAHEATTTAATVHEAEPHVTEPQAIAVEPATAAPIASPPLDPEPPPVEASRAFRRPDWPAGPTSRFLWQTDGDLVFTQVTPPFADVVGGSSDHLVGVSFADLAPTLDPSGRLATALASKANWSGLDVAWPIAGAAASVPVLLGGVPAFDRDRAFEGFRGYGVMRLDEARVDAPPATPQPPPAAGPTAEEPMAEEPPHPPHAEPGAGTAAALSVEDTQTFEALGAELREHVAAAPAVVDEEPAAPHEPHDPMAGRDPAVHDPEVGDVPDGADAGRVAATAAMAAAMEPSPEPPAADPVATPPSIVPMAPASPEHDRAGDVARNGLSLLDRLAVAVLVSRAAVPIFANRHFLDLTGFADEDALHAAGGMAHLFGGMPGNVTGAESIGIRSRDGAILPVTALMQRIDWDDLPATLLTLHPARTEPAKAPPAASEPLPPSVAAPREDVELHDLRAILETATDGVAVLDEQGNVLSLNRSAEALFGCDRSAVAGRPFLDLFASENRHLASDYLEGIKTCADKILLNDGRELAIRADRGTIPVFMTLGRLGDPHDETRTPRFCALFRDLTPWKKVERDLQSARHEAERASALKSDFLANVSHEIRTPLNSIIGFADVMIEERFGPLSARYKEYLRDIHTSGSHVMSLVNDLLDLSKIEAGKMELKRQPLDVNRIIGESVASMQPQASRERVIMRLSLAAHLPHVSADERSLRQILFNVLSNAVKYNEPGGQVIVASTLTEDGRVVVRVRDTGQGMSESDLAAALEPFRRLATSRPTAGGTGLGLPLTKALVEANDAAFSIRSKVDQGTMIEVSFPPTSVLVDHGNAEPRSPV